jgi:hypothetical protein
MTPRGPLDSAAAPCDDRAIVSDHQHQHGSLGAAIGGGEECALCPICVLLQALSSTRPEATEHLRAAARELVQALQVVLEGHDHRRDRDPQRLQRIRVE